MDFGVGWLAKQWKGKLFGRPQLFNLRALLLFFFIDSNVEGHEAAPGAMQNTAHCLCVVVCHSRRIFNTWKTKTWARLAATHEGVEVQLYRLQLPTENVVRCWSAFSSSVGSLLVV